MLKIPEYMRWSIAVYSPLWFLMATRSMAGNPLTIGEVSIGMGISFTVYVAIHVYKNTRFSIAQKARRTLYEAKLRDRLAELGRDPLTWRNWHTRQT